MEQWICLKCEKVGDLDPLPQKCPFCHQTLMVECINFDYEAHDREREARQAQKPVRPPRQQSLFGDEPDF